MNISIKNFNENERNISKSDKSIKTILKETNTKNTKLLIIENRTETTK